MTRSKGKPPLRKPVFDEDTVVRFVTMGAGEIDAGGDAAEPGAKKRASGRKAAKTEAATCAELTLALPPEVVARLRAEANRKGRSIDQVVAKLVQKHLGKH